MATKFIEPGGDADFGAGLWDASPTSNPTIVTDYVHGAHIKSYQFSNSSVGKKGIIADAGGRASFWIYVTALPTDTESFFLFTQTGYGTTVFRLRMTSAGVLQLWDASAQKGSDGTVAVAAGGWYRITIAWTITDTTHNEFRVWVNGSSSISITNANIANTASADLIVMNPGDATLDFRGSDFYVDDSTSLTDPGNIWVTAKRPYGNGTANDFTTQIGTGNSGYGSGHADEVNERALSTTNGWSVATTSSTTKNEEYNIESVSTGDIDITGATIMGVMGWVCGNLSSTSSQTAGIIVDGTYTAKTVWVTSGSIIFTQISPNPTTYPAGSGTDIGMRKVTATTSSRTGRLFECGIVVAYIPTSNLSINVYDTVNASEGITALRNSHNVNVYDSVNVSEDRTQGTTPKQINVFDSVTATENIVSGTTPKFINVFDSATATENVAIIEKNFLVSVFDSVNISEGVTTLEANLVPSVYDSVNASEGLTIEESTVAPTYYEVNVFDSVNVSESIRRWSGLGMNIGENTTSSDLDYMWSKGITKVRVEFPSYTNDHYYGAIPDLIATALSKGFYVVWGVTAGANFTGAQWTEFKVEVQYLAAWAESLNNSNFQFSVGNEEWSHNNGAGAPNDATVISDLKALAATCQGIYTKGLISYEASFIDECDDWITAGITPGTNIDVIGLNVYSADARWDDKIDAWYTTFGVNGYISEFNYGGFTEYSLNETDQATYINTIYSYIKSSGILTAYFYYWNYDGDEFGLKRSDGTYRLLWYVLSGSHAAIPYNSVAVSENITISVTTTVTQLSINVFDSITATETITTGTTPKIINVNDSVNATENITSGTTPKFINVFDSVAVSESISAGEFLGYYQISVYDGVSISESVTARFNKYNISLFDNVNLSENINALVNFYPVSVSDTLSISELINLIIIGGWYEGSEASVPWTGVSNVSSAWTDDSEATANWNDSSDVSTLWTDDSERSTNWS